MDERGREKTTNVGAQVGSRTSGTSGSGNQISLELLWVLDKANNQAYSSPSCTS